MEQTRCVVEIAHQCDRSGPTVRPADTSQSISLQSGHEEAWRVTPSQLLTTFPARPSDKDEGAVRHAYPHCRPRTRKRGEGT